mmetsp:Transcript_22302/g.46891  ORF Transcript_22302/g.46891 Transcript_22302/m.46891 type:complete len:96 (-) Transcript_22302:1916-2203(-)
MYVTGGDTGGNTGDGSGGCTGGSVVGRNGRVATKVGVNVLSVPTVGVANPVDPNVGLPVIKGGGNDGANVGCGVSNGYRVSTSCKESSLPPERKM